ncbi:MFS transporter [Pseudoclavibacter chungangensis]|uniref:MFS transporter n=1 Tax=Pseudoclavibacter chungangensis TaxID=587635 RepID=A0A7J5C2S6_9MICO|nr:MFS transporter [Pseudoclavibacter chungangensis]KAB1660402.1 MFS transporter [Pseudoclavibacter chungangensis]NYJ65768.1 MFS family permease [Pseudoclavibacter chungangensis]
MPEPAAPDGRGADERESLEGTGAVPVVPGATRGPVDVPIAPRATSARGPAEPTVTERIPPEIWTLLVATFFMAIGFGLIVPVLPQYANSFGVGATLVAVVVSAFAFMRFVSAPLGGSLVNRLGERPVYVVGMLLVAASTFATAFAEAYWQLLLFRGLGGIGSVMFSIAASGLLVRYAPPSLRGRVSALWGGMFLVGNITGPLFGGLLGQFGMRVPFLVYAATLVVSALIVAVFLRPGAVRGAGGPAASAPPRRLAEALRVPAYRAALVGGIANGWANFGVRSAVVPLFVAAVVSSEPWIAGLVVAVTAVGNVLALQWSGRAADRIGRRPLMLWGTGIAVVAMLVLVFTGDLVTLLVSGFVAGIGAGIAAPAQQAVVADVVGYGRSGGQVLSTFQMAQDFGTIVGPVVTGLVIDALGYGWGFGVAAAVLFLSFLMWFPARETLQKPDAR